MAGTREPGAFGRSEEPGDCQLEDVAGRRRGACGSSGAPAAPLPVEKAPGDGGGCKRPRVSPLGGQPSVEGESFTCALLNGRGGGQRRRQNGVLEETERPAMERLLSGKRDKGLQSRCEGR